MEHQTTLLDKVVTVTYETIVDDKDVEVSEDKAFCPYNEISEPHDLADRLFEEWRDEKRREELVL